jgi:diguanylate cyclase (GGDEF)-like protein/PAS domain S-box-containing protein
MRGLVLPEADDRGDGALTESEVLVEFLNLAPIGLIRFGLDGGIHLMNACAVQLLMPFAPGSRLLDMFEVFAALAPDIGPKIRNFTPPFGSILERAEIPLADGTIVYSLSVDRIAARTFVAVVQDVTRAAAQARRLRSHQALWSVITRTVSDHAICRVSVDGARIEWNPTLQRTGGWERGHLAGGSFAELLMLNDAGRELVGSLFAAARVEGTAEGQAWVARRDGSAYFAKIVVTATPGIDGLPYSLVVVIHDLSAAQELESLGALAQTDALTRIGNRRAGEAQLGALFRAWQQDGQLFGVVMADLDKFKEINDTLGHEAGDAALALLAAFLQARLAPGNVVVRWGGDEFLLLLAVTGAAEAQRIVDGLRAALALTPFTIKGQERRLSMSFGLALPGMSTRSAQDVVARADAALYEAKKTFRDQYAARAAGARVAVGGGAAAGQAGS